jgi:hypothetical protein
MKFDILLFSKTRFEKEHDDGSDRQGRTRSNLGVDCRCPYIGATRIRDCSCVRIEDIYSSPLKDLHFLRIIIDEGHEFSSATSRAVLVAMKLVTAERRWVVSGTPARERLFGVDIELAAHATTENHFHQESVHQNREPVPESEMRAVALEQQSRFRQNEERQGAARPIGILLSNFLQVRPWYVNLRFRLRYTLVWGHESVPCWSAERTQPSCPYLVVVEAANKKQRCFMAAMSLA